MKQKNYKVKKVDWYGFDHEAVKKKFGGDLSFINEFSIKTPGGQFYPVAVYKAKKPNIKEGHKKYMLLYTDQAKNIFVAGMSAQKMYTERFQEAILCTECNTVLYSISRHHYHTCGCSNDTMIDGGKDYTRAGAKDLSKTKSVLLDLVTNKIVREYK